MCKKHHFQQKCQASSNYAYKSLNIKLPNGDTTVKNVNQNVIGALNIPNMGYITSTMGVHLCVLDPFPWQHQFCLLNSKNF